MTNIDKAIARLEKLERLATPGPWDNYLMTANGRFGDYDAWPKFEEPPVIGSMVASLFSINDTGEIWAEITSPSYDKKGAADTALITAMRNALPELLQKLQQFKKMAAKAGAEGEQDEH